ncbi:MAG: phosphotransferase, partial [Demequina sp.]|uniref:phosphotransferase n=1 Tax=Demequina sp. TaxID=2050685 RepID=UPI003A8795DC
AEAGPTTWCHLDIHGRNVLSRKGRLAGIVDWGDAAAGSPATDLGQAAMLVGPLDVGPMLDAYLGSCHTDVAAFVSSAAGRRRIRAEAAHYALTLACMEDDPYRSAGREALTYLRQHPR